MKYAATNYIVHIYLCMLRSVCMRGMHIIHSYAHQERKTCTNTKYDKSLILMLFLDQNFKFFPMVH
jgi:hypothetical protein